MRVDFFAILEDSKNIKLYDVSPNGQSLPLNIYSMTLDILSSKIPNGQIDNKLDVMAYIANQRIQKEIYTVNSEILGFANSIDIPDGVYHFYYDVNNTDTKERIFLIYQKVEADTNAMLEAVNYNIEIGDYDLEYVGETSEYDIEKVRLAVTLLDSLKEQAKLPDEVKVNDTLDKLTRLLEIISKYINN